MRFALAAAAILIGGCRQSEEPVLAELRYQMMQRCSADMATASARNPGFDTRQFCGCLTDKAFADRNVAQVRQLFEDREKMVAAARQAAIACRPANAPDLPPIELEEPDPGQNPAAENKQGENGQNAQAERPRRNEAAPRPKAPPARPRGDGPIATPRPMPTLPPVSSPPPPPPPPSSPTPVPTPPARA